MATLEKRVQVLFDPDRYAQVEAEARMRGVSVGAFIREAVDTQIDERRDRAAQTLEELFARADATPQSPLPSWEEMKADHENEMDPMFRAARNAGETVE